MRWMAAPLLIALCGTAAQSETLTSAYTSYDLSSKASCRQVEKPSEGFGGASLCRGHGDLSIYTADGDARVLEAYGRDPARHCAARQTFFRFNSTNPTVEWRLADGHAFATIVLWHVVANDEGTKTKSWLVVTKLEPHNSCRVAVVEGALPDANMKAREAADGLARSFDCATGTPELIASPAYVIEDLLGGFPCADQP